MTVLDVDSMWVHHELALSSKGPISEKKPFFTFVILAIFLLFIYLTNGRSAWTIYWWKISRIETCFTNYVRARNNLSLQIWQHLNLKQDIKLQNPVYVFLIMQFFHVNITARLIAKRLFAQMSVYAMIRTCHSKCKIFVSDISVKENCNVSFLLALKTSKFQAPIKHSLKFRGKDILNLFHVSINT